MKKIFCDGCGEEMAYTEIPTYLKNGGQLVELKGKEKKLTFEVKVMFESNNCGDGQHIDLCLDCRLHLLQKLNPQPQVKP